MAQKRTFYLDTVLTFGKHKGKSIEEILRVDRGYLNWCKENLPWFDYSDKPAPKVQSDPSSKKYVLKKDSATYNPPKKTAKEIVLEGRDTPPDIAI